MNFDVEAARWDAPYRVRRAEALARALRRSLGDARRVLDFGCGTGLTAFALAGLANAARGEASSAERGDLSPTASARLDIVCEDASDGMTRILREKIVRAPTAGVRLALPDEGGFDAIYSVMVLHHIPDTAAILRALCGRLASGGQLLLIDLDAEDGAFHRNEPDFSGHNGFDRDWMARRMREAGLSDVRVETVWRGGAEDGGHAPYSLFLARGAVARAD